MSATTNSDVVTTYIVNRKRKINLQVTEFRCRESLLSILYDSRKDVQVLCKLTLIATCVYITVIVGYRVQNGSYKDDLDFHFWAFGGFGVGITNWFYLHICAIMSYYLTRLWVGHKIPSSIFTILSLTNLVTTFYIVCRPSVWNVVSPILRFNLVIEQVRLIMKVIPFTIDSARKRRSNSRRSRTSIHASEYCTENCDKNYNVDKTSHFCSLGHFVYFLFAPTLVYRDNYVKSRRPTDWVRVVKLQSYYILYLLVFYDFFQYVFMTTCDIVYQKSVVTLQGVMAVIVVGSIQGLLIMVAPGFIYFHCWLNAWAEILTFGDRQFYMDWWSQGNVMNYLRTWNLVVGDWILEYAYIPLSDITRSKSLSFHAVIFVSAVLHDYVMAGLLGFAIPVYTIMYPVAVELFNLLTWTSNKIPVFKALKDKMTNRTSATLLTIAIGCTWAFWLLMFTAEYYSRKHLCPLQSESWMDIVWPHFMSCIQWKVK